MKDNFISQYFSQLAYKRIEKLKKELGDKGFREHMRKMSLRRKKK